MEYKQQTTTDARFTPRIIIHGGAGNITPANLRPDKYKEHRDALLDIVSPLVATTTQSRHLLILVFL